MLYADLQIHLPKQRDDNDISVVHDFILALVEKKTLSVKYSISDEAITGVRFRNVHLARDALLGADPSR